MQTLKVSSEKFKEAKSNMAKRVYSLLNNVLLGTNEQYKKFMTSDQIAEELLNKSDIKLYDIDQREKFKRYVCTQTAKLYTKQRKIYRSSRTISGRSYGYRARPNMENAGGCQNLDDVKNNIEMVDLLSKQVNGKMAVVKDIVNDCTFLQLNEILGLVSRTIAARYENDINNIKKENQEMQNYLVEEQEKIKIKIMEAIN